MILYIYDDAVAETAGLEGDRIELTEDEMNELNTTLNRLLDSYSQEIVFMDKSRINIQDIITIMIC